jgi:hypothetical protein
MPLRSEQTDEDGTGAWGLCAMQRQLAADVSVLLASSRLGSIAAQPTGKRVTGLLITV